MEKKKVLIVEDEMIIAMLIERMVTNLGHEVVDKVSSGEAAIESAAEYDPDLILMDIRLKGDMDGIEAMSHIRKKTSTPVIYISGNTDKSHKQRVSQSDYIDFLRKPITMNDLDESFQKAV